MAIILNDSTGIQYSNVTLPDKAGNGKWTNLKYKDKSTGNDVNRYTSEISEPTSKFINAIDIDWNGATPGIGEDSSNGIKSTGELLSYIHNIKTSADNASSPSWSSITGKPNFTTVATSGSYNDLSDKPTILTLGTTHSTAAYGDHTHSGYALNNHNHNVNMYTYTGVGNVDIELEADTKYELYVGETKYVFKTPDNTNSDYESRIAALENQVEQLTALVGNLYAGIN